MNRIIEKENQFLFLRTNLIRLLPFEHVLIIATNNFLQQMAFPICWRKLQSFVYLLISYNDLMSIIAIIPIDG